jgi:hypothetical protein
MDRKQRKLDLLDDIDILQLEALKERLLSDDVRSSDIEVARKVLDSRMEERVEAVVSESREDSNVLPFKTLDTPTEDETEVDLRDLG